MIAEKIIWKKTAKGEEEISHRTHGLAQSLRRVLILVDGSSDETTVLRKGSILPDDVPLCLRELEKQEYIRNENVLPSISDIKTELIGIARKTLGAEADKIVEKIMETSDDKDALLSVLNRCKKLVKMAIDEKKADELVQQCNAVLSRLP